VPLASLKALAKHHADLQQHLPADEAEEAVRRRSRRRHSVLLLALSYWLGACSLLTSHLTPYLVHVAPCTLRLRGLVAALLPRFSMACVTEEEAAAAAKRREELEAIRKEREQLEAEKAEKTAEEAEEAGQQQSAAPGPPVEPAEEKREAGDASGVLV
jgi:hypothetical protein